MLICDLGQDYWRRLEGVLCLVLRSRSRSSADEVTYGYIDKCALPRDSRSVTVTVFLISIHSPTSPLREHVTDNLPIYNKFSGVHYPCSEVLGLCILEIPQFTPGCTNFNRKIFPGDKWGPFSTGRTEQDILFAFEIMKARNHWTRFPCLTIWGHPALGATQAMDTLEQLLSCSSLSFSWVARKSRNACSQPVSLSCSGSGILKNNKLFRRERASRSIIQSCCWGRVWCICTISVCIFFVMSFNWDNWLYCCCTH